MTGNQYPSVQQLEQRIDDLEETVKRLSRTVDILNDPNRTAAINIAGDTVSQNLADIPGTGFNQAVLAQGARVFTATGYDALFYGGQANDAQRAENLKLYAELSQATFEQFKAFGLNEGLTAEEQVYIIVDKLHAEGKLAPFISTDAQGSLDYFHKYGEVEPIYRVIRGILMSDAEFYAQVQKEAAEAAEQRAQELEAKARDSLQFAQDFKESQSDDTSSTWVSYDPVTTFEDQAVQDAEYARIAREEANLASLRALIAEGFAAFVASDEFAVAQGVLKLLPAPQPTLGPIEQMRADIDSLTKIVSTLNVDGRLKFLQDQVNVLRAEIGRLVAENQRTADDAAINRPPGSGVPW